MGRHQQKLTTVLVADEAHHLSEEVLEEIRLLTNLETPQGKLLQILLVGQPELDEKLDSTELRQLKQRIALRSQLLPLDLEETRGYILRRLQLSGADSHGNALFPNDTIAAVHRISRGIPRLINTICENALISAYARQLQSVPAEIINEVANDFRLNVGAKSRAEETSGKDGKELWHAVKTLVELHNQLQSVRQNQEQAPLQAFSEMRKHEPIV